MKLREAYLALRDEAVVLQVAHPERLLCSEAWSFDEPLPRSLNTAFLLDQTFQKLRESA